MERLGIFAGTDLIRLFPLEMTLSETSICVYQMYMQLGAVDSSIRPSLLKDMEREWAAPQGISTIKAPTLNSSLFMYSPNCRLTIRVKDAEGLKREKFYFKAVNYALMAGTVGAQFTHLRAWSLDE